MKANRVLVSQRRVAALLSNAGWVGPKRSVYELFKKHHLRVPGLVHNTNPHEPARSGIATWYQYESAEKLTAQEAEARIAAALLKVM